MSGLADEMKWNEEDTSWKVTGGRSSREALYGTHMIGGMTAL